MYDIEHEFKIASSLSYLIKYLEFQMRERERKRERKRDRERERERDL